MRIFKAIALGLALLSFGLNLYRGRWLGVIVAILAFIAVGMIHINQEVEKIK